MKQTVYVDTLICVNLLIDYFLLYAAAQLCGLRISRVRLCLAAALGAASACVVFLPALPRAVIAAVSVTMAVCMALAAYGWLGLIGTAKAVGCLLLITMCFGGVMNAIWLFAAPHGLIINNGAVYIDIDPLLLILTTVVMYTLITVTARLARRRNLQRSRCGVELYANGSTARLNAIIDTGNLLVEPFSGLPVVIAERQAVSALLPEGFPPEGSVTPDKPSAGVRLVPYSGIGGDGVMAAFRPERMCVEISGRRRKAEAYVGVLDGGRVGREYSAIVNPDAVTL